MIAGWVFVAIGLLNYISSIIQGYLSNNERSDTLEQQAYLCAIAAILCFK